MSGEHRSQAERTQVEFETVWTLEQIMTVTHCIPSRKIEIQDLTLRTINETLKEYLHSFKASPTKYSLIKREEKKSSLTMENPRRFYFNQGTKIKMTSNGMNWNCVSRDRVHSKAPSITSMIFLPVCIMYWEPTNIYFCQFLGSRIWEWLHWVTLVLGLL